MVAIPHSLGVSISSLVVKERIYWPTRHTTFREELSLKYPCVVSPLWTRAKSQHPRQQYYRYFCTIPASTVTSPSLSANEVAMSMTSSSSETSKLRVRVVSYNVLSSHLASPSHFSTYPPEHLSASVRLAKVISKLEEEIATSTASESSISPLSVLFCLQEVSYDWAGVY
jgi:hypothetical protein